MEFEYFQSTTKTVCMGVLDKAKTPYPKTPCTDASDFKEAGIYTTKGRDRFHWAATPLKPYKVENICYMTYRLWVLHFLNLSLKHFFSHRKRQFLWKYPNPKTVIVPCFNVSRMPNRRTSQSRIEDIVHCSLDHPDLSMVSRGVLMIETMYIVQPMTFRFIKDHIHEN